MRFDARTGDATTLLDEKCYPGGWINVHDAFKPLAASGEFLWLSERAARCTRARRGGGGGGALRRRRARAVHPEDVAAADEARSARSTHTTAVSGRLDRAPPVPRRARRPLVARVCLTAAGRGVPHDRASSTSRPATSLDRSVARAPATVARTRCRRPPGLAEMATKFGADLAWAGRRPAEARAGARTWGSTARALARAEGGEGVGRALLGERRAARAALARLHDAAVADDRVGGLALRPPELVTLPSADGAATLQAALYKPDAAEFGPGPWPTVVSLYGGPHGTVNAGWGPDDGRPARADAARARFLVLKLDNRGSARRGHAFEAPLRERMGGVEVADQAAGVRWAIARRLADPARVGVYGWSYGGYMTAHVPRAGARPLPRGRPGRARHRLGALRHVLHRAVHGPARRERGRLRGASVMTHVKGLKGRLLLCHGLLDENVLFRNTACLVNALIEHRKRYELLLFPDERHGPRKRTAPTSRARRRVLRGALGEWRRARGRARAHWSKEHGARFGRGGRGAAPTAPGRVAEFLFGRGARWRRALAAHW